MASREFDNPPRLIVKHRVRHHNQDIRPLSSHLVERASKVFRLADIHHMKPYPQVSCSRFGGTNDRWGGGICKVGEHTDGVCLGQDLPDELEAFADQLRREARDHGGAHVPVPKQLLDGPDVVAVLASRSRTIRLSAEPNLKPVT